MSSNSQLASFDLLHLASSPIAIPTIGDHRNPGYARGKKSKTYQKQTDADIAS